MSNFSAELSAARAIAKEAAALLFVGAGRPHASLTKASSIDLVTEYDRRAENLIVDRLGAQFPGDTILAEESGLHAASTGRRWLIDPLDGTTNFSHGLPFFCVSMALEVEGVMQVGAVEAPAMRWSFHAQKGQGAYLNDACVHVSQTDTLDRALLATGFPYDRQTSDENNFAEFVAFKKNAQGVRRVGSAALDLCMVAAGYYDGYWEMKLKPWDLAAGSLFVTEAGGRISNYEGRAPNVDAGWLVASNGRIHEEMIALLAETRAKKR